VKQTTVKNDQNEWRVRQDSNLQPSDPKFGPEGFCPVVTSCTKLQNLNIIKAFLVRWQDSMQLSTTAQNRKIGQALAKQFRLVRQHRARLV